MTEYAITEESIIDESLGATMVVRWSQFFTILTQTQVDACQIANPLLHNCTCNAAAKRDVTTGNNIR
jgi:hypothetical protein